jgi:PAS domain S-box-containing protein
MKDIDHPTENRYKELADLLPQSVFEIDDTGRLMYVNQCALEKFGYTHEELEKGLSSLQMFVPEQRTLAIENIKVSILGKRLGLEYTMQRKDGSTFPAIIDSSPIIRNGCPVGLRGIIIDISERKKMENALQENEQLLRSLVDNMLDATLILDWNGNVLFANNAAAKLVDIEAPVNVKDFNIRDFLHPEHAQKAFEHLERVNDNKGGFLWQYKIITEKGSEKWVESLGTKIQLNGSSANVVNLRDITERKRAEEALKETVDKYRNIFENAVEGIFQSAPEGRFIDVNPALAHMMGFQTPDEMIRNFTDIAHQHYVRPEERSEYSSLLERDGLVKGFETEVYRKDKKSIWISINARAVRDKSGNVLYYEGTVENITERKQYEDSLKSLEELESSILSAIPHAVIGLQARSIIFANDSVKAVFGWTSRELIGKNTRILYRSDEEYEEIGKRFYPALEKQRFHREVFDCRRKDGKDIVCMVSSARIGSDLTDKKIVVIYEDITERKRTELEKGHLEAQLRQAQKMEAIGQLAGGVAHDFNNILTAVIGYGNLLKAKMAQDDPLRTYVEHILASSGKAVNLTQSLLAFGRKQIIELKPCKISTLIKNVEKLLARLLTEDIELLTFISPSDPTILADPTQIDQILINLATNARDAMPNGGHLKIEVKLAEINRAFVESYGYGEIGRYALISVSDTGLGMDTTTREKIFDPFFTTKEVGKGTGLGLSIVYGIVKQHNGYINVESEPGRGTSFHIYLPIVKMKEEKIESETISTQGGSETILIGEDNASVRQLAKEVLEQFGYSVIEARDGEDAIGKFEQSANNIDLVILDVVMPKKNGREVYEAIKKIKPQIKVFFMSGYTADILSDKGMHEEKLDYTPKPISPQEFLVKVRAVLDNK